MCGRMVHFRTDRHTPQASLLGTMRRWSFQWRCLNSHQRALATKAHPNVASYKDRHVAVFQEEDWIAC